MDIKDLNQCTFFYGDQRYYLTGFQSYRKPDGDLVVKVIGGVSVETGDHITLTNNIDHIKLSVV